MTYQVTKYPNRRLYVPDRGYITLEDVGEAFDQGETIEVRVRKGGANITIETLLQVLIQRVEAGKLKLTQAQIKALVRA